MNRSKMNTLTLLERVDRFMSGKLNDDPDLLDLVSQHLQKQELARLATTSKSTKRDVARIEDQKMIAEIVSWLNHHPGSQKLLAWDDTDVTDLKVVEALSRGWCLFFPDDTEKTGHIRIKGSTFELTTFKSNSYTEVSIDTDISDVWVLQSKIICRGPNSPPDKSNVPTEYLEPQTKFTLNDNTNGLTAIQRTAFKTEIENIPNENIRNMKMWILDQPNINLHPNILDPDCKQWQLWFQINNYEVNGMLLFNKENDSTDAWFMICFDPEEDKKIRHYKEFDDIKTSTDLNTILNATKWEAPGEMDICYDANAQNWPIIINQGDD